MESILKALQSAIEVWDPYTAQHQKRVAQLALAVAEEMKLSNSRKELLRYAALLHDIGKINLPLELLSKPGKLENCEINLIHRHSEIGFEILKRIDFPPEVAQIVLQHHEMIDGTGYPRGLFGSEILLEARILMVANTIEAISSNRPYRPVIGMKEAQDEIKKNRGSKYDPEVVDACMLVLLEKKFTLDDLKIHKLETFSQFAFQDRYETDPS
ncbi:MAG: HD domain-containing protein [Candidatus Cloacimonadales bacterium]|nr:HD domain-containing protein [Candidatus Cloacimonadales bacterium]